MSQDTGLPPGTTTADEILSCSQRLWYFVQNYGSVQDGDGTWHKFSLWPDQLDVCDVFDTHDRVAVLKARQLGLSWLSVHECLLTMLMQPGAKVGLFSVRQNEAADLLQRCKDVYSRLPWWMKPGGDVALDNKTEWRLGNGSRGMAFATNTGDSYTLSLAVIDEADLVDDLDRFLGSVQPTVNAGGRLRLISRANKRTPNSAFKRIYRAGRLRRGEWVATFLPWSARPDRDAAWYARECEDALARTGSLDYVYEQYPANDSEALSPNSQDKRLPGEWLSGCYAEATPLRMVDGPAIPSTTFRCYERPAARTQYVMGADSAEGNPHSDDSAVTVLEVESGREVASISGKLEPSAHGAYIKDVSEYYNDASVLPERNNHGHALILWLRDNAPRVRILRGGDGNPGWATVSKSKAELYAALAACLKAKEVTIRDADTYRQLASVEGATLNAPKGDHDDLAVSFALANYGRRLAAGETWLPPFQQGEQPLVRPRGDWRDAARSAGGVGGSGAAQPGQPATLDDIIAAHGGGSPAGRGGVNGVPGRFRGR